jgi:hypothetical protein
MAAFTVSKVANDGYSLSWPGNKLTVLRKRVDFSVAANNLAQNGIMGIFKVPADCFVLKFGMKVITVDADIETSGLLGVYTETAAGVITVVDADGYGVTGQILTVAGYVASDVDAAFNSGGADSFHPLADNSVLTFTNLDSATVDAAVVDFFAVLVDVSGYSQITTGGTGSYTT